VVYMRSPMRKGRCTCILGRIDGVLIRGRRFRFVGHVLAHMQSLLIGGNESEERKRGRSNMQNNPDLSITFPEII
jgi:hypothetical protein